MHYQSKCLGERVEVSTEPIPPNNAKPSRAMKETANRAEHLLPSQSQLPSSAQSLDVQPIPHNDNEDNDVPIKEHPKPLANETSDELEKRESIDCDLTENLHIQKPTSSDVSDDLEKQKPQPTGGKGEEVVDQEEVPAEDPNLVCLPLCACCGKVID